MRIINPFFHDFCTVSSCLLLVTFSLHSSLLPPPSFPPTLSRSTALGVQSVMGRLGAIAGNISFGKLFESGATPYLPILLVAAVLIIAGVTTLFLPNPRGEKSRRKCSRLRWRVSWARCCRFTRNTEILN